MKIGYLIWQWVWGLPQNFLGAMNFFVHRRCRHFWYHGALVTVWKDKSSVSLGMFLFLTEEPFFCEKLKDDFTAEALSHRLLVHEYGHTIQSLILGPMYLILMGIPSAWWGFSPSMNRKRKEEQLSYFSFFTEKWANALGEKVTGEPSMGNLVID